VPYNGSFFGLAPAENAVVVFGLRGNVFRSDDGGQNWSKVDAGLTASVVASTSASGRVLLADAGGRVAASADGGRSFKRLTLNPALPLTGLVPAGEGRFATVGPRGVTMAHAKPD
jgi:photosystem II stability/assembly factor-like uncharacterized protein